MSYRSLTLSALIPCSLALALPAAAALPADHVVTTTVDTRDANPGDGLCADGAGACSLRAAIMEANAAGGSALIDLQPGATYALTLGGPGENGALGGDLDVFADVRVRGMDATIDGSGRDRAFDVRPGGRLHLQDLTLMGGMVVDTNGGAIRSEGTLTVLRTTMMGNVAMGIGASGGSIYNDNGYTEVIRSTISGSSASRAGGAIEASAGTTFVLRSTLADNTTGDGPGNGGAVHLSGFGSVHLSDTLIQGNTASAEGGGLWNSDLGTMTVDGCTLIDNLALGDASDQGGGGLYNDGGTFVVTDSELVGNAATGAAGSGGGAFNQGGELYLIRTLVDGNSAQRAGGGIEALAGTTAVLRSTLSSNSTGASPGNGGGLHLTGAGQVTVSRSTVDGNVASAEGGGLWNSGDGSMLVLSTDITNNVASGDGADQGGGGLFNAGGYLQVQNSTLSDNIADGASGSGGGVLNDQGVLEMTDTVVMGNAAMRAGGGVEANIGTTSLVGVALDANRTGTSPGNGGGLHLTGAGYVGLDQCSVTSNVASNEGGGLWNSSTGVMEVTSSSGGDNTAPVGPNLYNDGGTFTVNGTGI